MGIYVITGGTTGIGAEARKKLQDEGHEVFNIDYNGGDYTADLSTDEGRKGAVKAVFLKYPDGIDGVLCNAGVGPTAPPKKIFALNFFAAIAIAEGLRPLLKKKGGNCVVTSSNSITNATGSICCRMWRMRTPQWNLPDISRRTKHRPATAPPSTRWPAGYAAYLLPGRQTACASTPWHPAIQPLR